MINYGINQMQNSISRSVLELIKRQDGRPCKKKITLYTELYRDMGIVQDEASDFFNAYFDKFPIKSDNFDFLKYFPNEGDWLIPNRFLPKSIRPTGQKPAPLTIRMLLKSAKAGRWLYD